MAGIGYHMCDVELADLWTNDDKDDQDLEREIHQWTAIGIVAPTPWAQSFLQQRENNSHKEQLKINGCRQREINSARELATMPNRS